MSVTGLIPMTRKHDRTRAGRHARVMSRITGAATLHARGGDPRLDAALALAELAVNGGRDALDRLCAHVARACDVDVCSIYVRELEAATTDPHAARYAHPTEVLVLRATRGLPRRAVGNVRMRIGEGLTGAAAACARPISVAELDSDARNFPVANLGEERFPGFCAVPLIESGRVIAVLVVQRREREPWTVDDVAQVASLAAAALIVVMRVRDTGADRPQNEYGAGAIRVRGEGSGDGIGIGPAYVVPAPTSGFAPSSTAQLARHCPIDRSAERTRLTTALDAARAEIAALVGPALRRLATGPGRRALLAYESLLSDARMEEAAIEEIERGAFAEVALERVARTYARVLGGGTEDFLRVRADDFEESIGRVFDHLGGIGPANPAPLGAIVVATRLGIGGALQAYSRRPSGVIITDTPASAPAVTLLSALGVPVVAGAEGALAFIRGGDCLLVDASSSEILIRPSRAQIADARRRRRLKQTTGGREPVAIVAAEGSLPNAQTLLARAEHEGDGDDDPGQDDPRAA